MILGLCDRWRCPPSVILAEPADPLVRLLQIEAMGKREEVDLYGE